MQYFSKIFLVGVASFSFFANANDAVKALIEGNGRFVDNDSKLQDSVAGRAELNKGQTPRAAVLSCSDSRVSPEFLFDQGLGELYVVRNAGPTVDSTSIASLEHAVEHLGVKVLMVLGHEGCGALRAAMTLPKGVSAGSKDLDKLVQGIRPRVNSIRLLAADDKKLRPAAIANVNGVAKELLARSKVIREKANAGELTIAEGVYEMESGKVAIVETGRKFTGVASAEPVEEPEHKPAPVKKVKAKPVKKHVEVKHEEVEKREVASEHHDEHKAEHKAEHKNNDAEAPAWGAN